MFPTLTTQIYVYICSTAHAFTQFTCLNVMFYASLALCWCVSVEIQDFSFFHHHCRNALLSKAAVVIKGKPQLNVFIQWCFFSYGTFLPFKKSLYTLTNVLNLSPDNVKHTVYIQCVHLRRILSFLSLFFFWKSRTFPTQCHFHHILNCVLFFQEFCNGNCIKRQNSLLSKSNFTASLLCIRNTHKLNYICIL